MRQLVPHGRSSFPEVLIASGSVKDLTPIAKIDRIMRSKGTAVAYPFLVVPSRSRFKLVWDTVVLVMILWIMVFLPW
jgi:hypothetical protein